MWHALLPTFTFRITVLAGIDTGSLITGPPRLLTTGFHIETKPHLDPKLSWLTFLTLYLACGWRVPIPLVMHSCCAVPSCLKTFTKANESSNFPSQVKSHYNRCWMRPQREMMRLLALRIQAMLQEYYISLHIGPAITASLKAYGTTGFFFFKGLCPIYVSRLWIS